MAFYHKYRPQKFEDLIGQDHIRKILTESFRQNRPSHAYLFAGPRGLGKTSTARLLAKAFNCLTPGDKIICNNCQSCLDIAQGRHLDVIEIDAASNRGIDEIRDLRDKIRFAPNTGRFKIYIIDEVHMLTKEAFNALLKTLEEPPAHVVFILATTEPFRVPATIISRVQRFDFKRPNVDIIAKLLDAIVKQEKIKADNSVLNSIAGFADGSFRDAITMLEQVATATEEISEDSLTTTLGLPTFQTINDFVNALLNNDSTHALALIETFYQAGVDFGFLYKQLIVSLREKMLSTGNPAIAPIISKLIEAADIAKLSPLPQIPLELLVMDNSPVKNQGTPNQNHKKYETNALPQNRNPAKTQQIKLNESSWRQIIEATRPYNHSLAGILQESKLLNISEDIITLAVRFSFYKDRIEEPKNQQKIAEAVAKILGRNIKIACEIDQSVNYPNDANDWLVKEAEVLFGARKSPESTQSTD